MTDPAEALAQQVTGPRSGGATRPTQPIPVTSAPGMNSQKRTRKIPDTKAGSVTDAAKV